MRITSKTYYWPIGVLPVMVVVSAIMPRPNNGFLDTIDGRIHAIGIGMISIRYLYAWRKGAPFFDFIVYVLLGVFIPYAALIFVELISKFV